MNNLFTYIIGTQSVIEMSSYIVSDLNNNQAFISSTYSTMDGYSNITSISNWDEYGHQAGLTHYEIKLNIEEQFQYLNQIGTTWSSLSLTDKQTLSKYFIVDKYLRDEIHTEDEQDENDHFIIYHHLTNDAKSKLGNYSMKNTPKSVDYKKDLESRLHPKYTFDNFGWLIECEYFENLIVTTNSYGFHIFNYSNPVIKYQASYNIGIDGYVTDRTAIRSWYLASGTYSTDTKNSFKVYEPLTARGEGRRRRQNLISRLIIDTVGIIIMTSEDLNNVYEAEEDGIPFMRDIESDISAYYEYGTKKDAQGNSCKLIQTVSGHTYSRLDNWVPGTGDTVTIRDFILNRLNPQ